MESNSNFRPDQISGLYDQLSSLQVKTRRLTIACVSMGAFIALACILGAGTLANAPEKLVRAEAFELVDTKGETRGRWQLDDERPVLLFRQNSEHGVVLGVDEEGGFLNLIAKEGEGFTMLGVDGDGGRLAIANTDGFLTLLVDNDDNGGRIGIVGKKGNGGTILNVSKAGDGSAIFIGSNDKPAVVIEPDEDGGQVLVLSRENDARARMACFPEGGTFDLASNNGETKVVLGAGKSGGFASVFNPQQKLVGIMASDDEGNGFVATFDMEGDETDVMPKPVKANAGVTSALQLLLQPVRANLWVKPDVR